MSERGPEGKERVPVTVFAAAFIMNSQDGLLLVQQAPEARGHKWGPPAGGMKAYEGPIETAIRETREEVGIVVQPTGLIGVYLATYGDNASGLGFAFRARIIGGGVIKPSSDEIADVKFFSIDELNRLVETEMVYRPELTIPAIIDWLIGLSFPLEVIRPIKP